MEGKKEQHGPASTPSDGEGILLPCLNDLPKPERILSGLEHLGMIRRFNAENRSFSEPLFQERKDDLRLLGYSLTALYEAATCNRKCWGTNHVLEMLGGRIYNLACASYSLISIAYYDEALSLVRSIGEIANLISLSVSDKVKFTQWLHSSKGDRIRNFSPAKVRQLPSESSGNVLMGEKWYSELCEGYTHLTPTTKPNNFNRKQRAVTGRIVKVNGFDSAIEQLTIMVSITALYYCKYFELNYLFGLIVNDIDERNSSADASGVTRK